MQKYKCEHISKKIKELRLALGWSASQLARASGVSSMTIGKLEKGERHCFRVETLYKICEGLNIKPSTLITDAPITNENIESAENKAALALFEEFKNLAKLRGLERNIVKDLINSILKSHEPCGAYN